MKLEETILHPGGLMRCCINTVYELDKDKEFKNGDIVDCKYETVGNKNIILVDGVWRYNNTLEAQDEQD